MCVIVLSLANLTINTHFKFYSKEDITPARLLLSISSAFIEKIIPDLANAAHENLLIACCYCFAGVIFISLMAHFISIMANRWAIAHDESEKNYFKLARYWNLIIRSINLLMIFGLCAGIIMLIQFINHNI